MDTEGAHDGRRGTGRPGAVPPPAGPPAPPPPQPPSGFPAPVPSPRPVEGSGAGAPSAPGPYPGSTPVPPAPAGMPAAAPGGGPNGGHTGHIPHAGHGAGGGSGAAPGGPGAPFLDWVRAPRPEAPPGIWRHGHRPRPPEEPERIPGRSLLSGALISFLCGWLIWSLCWNGYLGDYWLWPLLLFTPDSWREAGGNHLAYVWAAYLYYGLFAAGLVVVFGRLGRWPELYRRWAAPLLRRLWDDGDRQAPPPPPEADPAEWPELRSGGAPDAADRLAAEARAGRLTDVDYARIRRAWTGVRGRPERLPAFTDTVLRHGAAACLHPSGARDLPVRTARHDLAAGQVRLGTAADDRRNPYRHRGAGFALAPELLATSLLAVGPPGAGKTGRLVRPVLESLCLQALTGRTAVVAVGASGAQLAPDGFFDVVIRIGRPDSAHDLDLYGGTTDPDEAAGILAEALIGDLAAAHPGGGARRAPTALAQLLGPFRAAHDRFPSVPELRELLDGSATALGALRTVLRDTGQLAQARELDARERQSGRADDACALLADRLALLDRPAFADFFATAEGSRPFSLRALDHPLRVRIDLPERGHAEASRILARLVLAQFTECAVGRADRSLFACLVLHDASDTITAEALRGVQRLRSANAGALLTLRTLDDVPEALRSTLLGTVGCRMAFAGVTTWDGARFAEVWGKEWVEARDVTNRQIITDEPLTRVVHFIRRLVTGRAVTSESVTVRQVERERWSASELAHSLPPEHAVISLTTARGEHAPPLLVDLRS
ncbi:ATP-binding protein [Streptomyces xinghaiensis]|uniref:ATP-binding protein n=1 Tax=Streptomyces xinghaiensis TaxID=1038928 RepID=UPI001EDDE47B|nr:ATP-binding protein [Streptomyces xinghaiensis]